MKRKYSMLLAMCAAVAIVLLLTGSTAQTKPRAYKLEGAWIAKVPGTPLQWNYVMAPIDPSGGRAALTISLNVRIPGELLFPGIVPPVDYFTPFVGEAVMTGSDTATFTAVGYAMKKVVPSEAYPFWEQVAFICVSSGTMKFSASGKVEAIHHIADYLPAADGDGDGLPDADQTPFLCLPPTATLDTRLGFMPPCTPVSR